MNYRLKVKIGRKWKWGLNTYRSLEEANARKAEMERAGCKVKVALESELFRG